ncbi:MAG TPA: tetratricopeptide repeat protein, partial [Pseudonocardiaceae bacterium]
LADERHRLDLLDAGDDPRTAVRAVFSWSYHHLPAEAATLFRLLGLHPGRSADAGAAAALLGEDGGARRLLGLLVRAHLVSEPTPGRFTMHDLLRTWAAERAVAEDGPAERASALERLYGYYVCGAASAIDLLYPAEQHRRPPVPDSPVVTHADRAAARAWLDAEGPNLVAVAGRAHAPLLSAILWRHLDVSSRYQEAEPLHRLALADTRRSGDRAGQAHALNNLAVLHWRLGRPTEAMERLRPALALYREVGDAHGIFRSLINLGGALWQLCDSDGATEHHEQALAVAVATDDGIGQAVALYNLGAMHERAGRYAEAERCCARSLELYRSAGDRVGEASVVAALGILATRRGRPAEAEERLVHGLELSAALGSRIGEARIRHHLGTLYERTERHQEALELHRQALAAHEEVHDPIGRVDTTAGVARALTGLGELTEAIRQARAALTLASELDHRLGLALAGNALGTALRLRGDPVRALAAHIDAEDHAQAIGELYEQARAVHGIGDAHHDLGDHEQAVLAWAQAQSTYDRIGLPDTTPVADGTRGTGDMPRSAAGEPPEPVTGLPSRPVAGEPPEPVTTVPPEPVATIPPEPITGSPREPVAS